ncbi:MAG: hypothetical protein KatS3mg101_0663 [Patescibacteria group bacterium]|nr:MAG: hypothetical protein KatS3mg101_0663 [Patescibacteria group bacterium]
MNVYVFGNRDSDLDNRAFEIADKLSKRNNDVRFIEIKPNQDLIPNNKENIIILDTIYNIKTIKVLNENDIDKIITAPRTSVHDFDLAFQLKYLKKIGKLGKVTIIGIPQKGRVDYRRIQSILRKLVAQDMQGS